MSTPPRVPSGWDVAACEAWARGERVAAVQATLAAINRQAPQAPLRAGTRLALQGAYYLFLMGDMTAAAQLLQARRQRDPADLELALNLGVVLRRLGRNAEALPVLQWVLQHDPHNAAACDGLATCHHQLGQFEAAAEAGRRSLAIKHSRRQPPPADWRLPQASPQAWASQPGKRDVIVFSLWGAQPRYLRGALRNVLLAHDLYPGWVLQFHIDDTVPADFVALITELGAEVHRHPAGQPLRERLCWRFAAAHAPDVGRFLVRDADSVISVREVQAVQAWCAGDRWFHVMRDWWSHTDLMLAGMWGGVAGVLPDLAALLKTYESPAAETPNIDQWFLRDRVWGYVCPSVQVHDRCFGDDPSQHFPGPTPTDRFHVGQDEFAVRRDWQAAWLAPWAARCPSLGIVTPTPT